MDYWGLIDFVDAFEDSRAQFLLGLNADMLEKGSGHLAEQCLDDVQPRTVFGCMDVDEPVWTCLKEGACFFGSVC